MAEADSSNLKLRIKIISKCQIRYEGDLAMVESDNPEEPVITLVNVISYGTEDRTCERKFPPSNAVYERVVFRGQDLQDITVISNESVNDDPAIISAGPKVGQDLAPIGTKNKGLPKSSPNKDLKISPEQSLPFQESAKAPTYSNNVFTDGFNQKANGYTQNNQHHYRQQQNSHRNDFTDHRRGPSNPKPGYNRSNYRGRGNNRVWQNRQVDTTQYEEDYDIEEANKILAAELEKLNINNKYKDGDSITGSCHDGSIAKESSINDDEENAVYDKEKSFFDSLSSEIMDKANGINKQPRRDERRLNSTTFGLQPHTNNYNRNYGYRRGGASGGRYGNRSGGNRGRWRGGMNYTHNKNHPNHQQY